MSKLPRDVSGRSFVKVMKKRGYYVDEQEGSHIILCHPEPAHKRLSVPDHKFLKVGLIRKLIKEAGLSPEQFRDLL